MEIDIEQKYRGKGRTMKMLKEAIYFVEGDPKAKAFVVLHTQNMIGVAQAMVRFLRPATGTRPQWETTGRSIGNIHFVVIDSTPSGIFRLQGTSMRGARFKLFVDHTVFENIVRGCVIDMRQIDPKFMPEVPE